MTGPQLWTLLSPHNHMIVIRALGNQFTIMTVAISHDHIIILFDLH